MKRTRTVSAAANSAACAPVLLRPNFFEPDLSEQIRPFADERFVVMLEFLKCMKIDFLRISFSQNITRIRLN